MILINILKSFPSDGFEWDCVKISQQYTFNKENKSSGIMKKIQ